ncbi:hypothetical protein GCM10020256_48670 [Streptomyces thermocoprophilus]
MLRQVREGTDEVRVGQFERAEDLPHLFLAFFALRTAKHREFSSLPESLKKEWSLSSMKPPGAE